MPDDRSNWTRALEARRMRILVSDLIRIGATLGLDVAERVYLSLKDEPRTAHHDRVDWTVIAEAITRQRAR